MQQIPPFSAQKLEAACRILGDTERGLTGLEIGYLLEDCRVEDVNPDFTKWKRLFNALAGAQNHHKLGNHLIMFINRALDPARHSRTREKFEWLRSELNVVLAFSGYGVGEHGKVIRAETATTLTEARARAGALKAKLEARGAHAEVFKYCQAELLEENYFHAVLEGVKGVADRIRTLSGLTSDGADLFNIAFSAKAPMIAINALTTETQISEQRGFCNILVGLFGAVRNPTAHAPKIYWPMTEQDALDIFALMSFIHRKLDCATIKPRA
jgi:uncharacterized protein (TIGR02391 family)